MQGLEWLQWPAMVTTVAASWLVASRHAGQRKGGFWLFLLSNVLWVAWGVQATAPALVVLQVALAAINIRGAVKARSAQAQDHDEADGQADRDRNRDDSGTVKAGSGSP